jgi:hypothetical protein
MRSRLFRHTALEQLSSPDRLDDTIQVTDTRAWLALAAVGVLLAAVVGWGVLARVPTVVRADGFLLRASGVLTIEAPTAGRVQALLARPGERVAAGQAVARLARGDGQTVEVAAGAAGQIVDVRAAVGGEIERGAALYSMEQPDQPLEARVYLVPEQARRATPGMMVQLTLASAQGDDAGILLGEVASVGAFPVTVAGLRGVLGNEDLARALVASGPPVEVRVALQEGAAAGLYRWRGGEPSPARLALLQGGAPLTAEIITAEHPPIALVLGQGQR